MSAPLPSAPPRRPVEASLLEQAPAAIVVTDRNGKIVYWNREAASLYGWSRADAVGRDLLSLVATQADEADPAFDVFETLGAGMRWTGDLYLRHRDGEPLHVHARGRPLMSSGGAQVGVMIVTVPASESSSDATAPPRDDQDEDRPNPVPLFEATNRDSVTLNQSDSVDDRWEEICALIERLLVGLEAQTLERGAHAGVELLERPLLVVHRRDHAQQLQPALAGSKRRAAEGILDGLRGHMPRNEPPWGR